MQSFIGMPGIFCRIPDIACGNDWGLEWCLHFHCFWKDWIFFWQDGEMACRLPWSSLKWISGVFRPVCFSFVFTSGNNLSRAWVFWVSTGTLEFLTKSFLLLSRELWLLSPQLHEIIKISASIFRLQALLSACFVCFFQHFVHCMRGLGFGKYFEEKLNGEFRACIYDSLFFRIMAP